jgi:hypothetical protein
MLTFFLAAEIFFFAFVCDVTKIKFIYAVVTCAFSASEPAHAPHLWRRDGALVSL